MNKSLIELHNVSYIYNKKSPSSFEALRDVNLELEEGEFIAIVGKTGSGKSTLIQTLNALLLPSEGYTRVSSFFVTQNKKEKKELKKEYNLKNKNFKKYAALRKMVGIVFQFPEYQLFSDNVLKDVMFGPKNFGMSDEEATKAAKEALTKVGIDESYYKRSPFELSGGEKRKVAIAGIIASSPKILILDEPTVGLDPQGKVEILNLIKKIHQNGTTIIIVTHDMDVVSSCATKVVVLKDSKFIKKVTPQELFNSSDIDSYSLEIPTFYKFKKLLEEKYPSLDIKNEESLEEVIKKVIEIKEDK